MLLRNWRILLLSLAAALLLAACGNQATPEPTPTRTPRPTFTPTPQGQVANTQLFQTPTIDPNQPTVTTEAILPTDTPAPPTDTPIPATDTPAPTVEPTVQPAAVFSGQVVNVRSGPGTNYGLIGRMNAGQRYPVTGKNADGSWWQIDYGGQPGWVTGSLVQTEGAIDAVQVATNIPAAPPRPTPRPTPIPQPTSPPAPTQPPAPQYTWQYVEGSARGAPQCGVPNFEGQVQYADGTPENGVCVYIDYFGPRQIKFSGGGGKGNGNWGFSPCGSGDCVGTHKVYIVQCPEGIPDGGITPASAPPPQSNVFSATITNKCETGQWTNIIFKRTR